MRIRTVAIRNLRSIRDVDINIRPLTALIGANNAGKSTILKAIELFFDPAPKISPDDYTKGDKKEPIEITIAFDSLTPEEKAEFSSALIDEKLEITRQFAADGVDSGQYSVQARTYPGFAALRDEKGVAKRTKHNALAESLEGLEPVTAVAEVEAALSKWELEHPEKCKPQRVRGFFGAVNVANGKIRKKTTVHVLPAVRDLTEAAGDPKRSPVISLLSEIARQSFENRKQFTEFKERAEEEFSKLTDPATVPELGGISKLLTESLQQFYSDSQLQATWENPQGIALNFPTPSLSIDHSGITTDLAHVGHGLQRAALFSVVQFLAQRASPTESAGGAEFSEAASDIILLVEEPEIYQHPSKQLVIFDAFRRLVSTFNKGTGIRVQIIYATHSEKFIRMDEFESARIIRRHKVGSESKSTASALTIAQCSKDFSKMLVPPRDPLPDEAFVAKLHIFSREVCEGFFATKVILVEGVTDKAILEAAYTLLGRNVHQEAISIISMDGKTKMDKPAYIFSRLGIPTYLVFDNDQTAGGDKEKRTNHLLQKICGIQNPEDWPAGAKATFAAIEGKLEKYMRSILGNKYEAYFNAVSDEFDLSADDIKKTPAALVKVFHAAKDGGISLDLFTQVIEKVDRLT